MARYGTWQAELNCAYEHLREIDRGEPTTRDEEGKIRSHTKLGLTCVKRARTAVARQPTIRGTPRRGQGGMTKVQRDNAEAKIALIESKLKYKPKKQKSGNGRKQAGFGLALKPRPAGARPKPKTQRAKPPSAKKPNRTARGEWARVGRFEGKAWSFEGNHSQKSTAEAHARRILANPGDYGLAAVPHRSRIAGSAGDYAVYVRPKSKPNGAASKRPARGAPVPKKTTAKRKPAAKKKTAPKRKTAPKKAAESLVTQGPAKYISWAGVGSSAKKTTVHAAKTGRGWICTPADGKARRYATLDALKRAYKSRTWHRPGTAAAKRPQPPSTAKSAVKVPSYTRKATVKSYTRTRGRMPKRIRSGRFTSRR